MSSAIEQINTHLESLSFDEMVTLNEQIGIALRKLSGGAKPAAAKRSKKGSKKGADASDSDAEPKPKRKAAAGTLAWTAFVKHIKETQPAEFADVKKEAEKLTVVKRIRAENIAAYDSFVKDWKEKYVASSEAASVAEQAEEAEAVPAPVPYSDWAAPAKPKTAAEKLAEIRAAKAAEKAAKEASAAPTAAAAPTPKKPVKTVAAKAAPGAPKKTAKATEESQMPQMEIDGKMYWHDPGTQGLWEVTGETFSGGSTWMGYFQPGNDDEPIRYTENFGDE
jgi:hypothetical protein